MIVKKIVLLLTFGLFSCYVAGQKNTLLSPHDALYTHLNYLSDSNYNALKAAQVINERVPRADAKELVIALKDIYEGRGLTLNLALVPTDANYKDGKDSTKNNRYTPFPVQLPDIYLEKNNGVWQYSLYSLQQIPRLYSSVYPSGSEFLLEQLPKMGKQNLFGEFYLWQLISIFLFLLTGYLLFRFINFILQVLLKQAAKVRFGAEISNSIFLQKFAKHTAWLPIFLLTKAYIPVLQLPSRLTFLSIQAVDIAIMLLILYMIVHFIDFALVITQRFLRYTENTLDDALLPIVGTIVKLFFTTILSIRILYILNVNVGALIAGISIGGLALALAAQDTVKNLIGSLIIFADRPFQTGDTIKSNEVNGVVERVGFRSTRIRTPDATLVSIPNGKMADATIDNIDARTARRFKTNLTINAQVSHTILADFIARLQLAITQQKDVIPEKVEVCITEIANNQIHLSLIIPLTVTTNEAERTAKHQLFMLVMKIAEEYPIVWGENG